MGKSYVYGLIGKRQDPLSARGGGGYYYVISSVLRSEVLKSFEDWKFPYKETKSINNLPYVAI